MRSIGHYAWVLFAAFALSSLQAAAAPLKLTLPLALKMALSANRDLAVSSLSLQAERYGIEGAESEFYPRLRPVLSLGRAGTGEFLRDSGYSQNSYGLQLSQKVSLGTMLTLDPTYTRMQDQGSAAMSLTLEQPLLRGFGPEATLDSLHRAEYSATLAREALAAARINTALSTISAYHEAMRQQRSAEIQGALAQSLRQHVAVTRSKEKARLNGPMDSYRAQLSLKEAENSLAQAQQLHTAALDRLRLLLNVDPATELELQAPPQPELAVADPEGEALKHNNELLQMRLNYQEAQRGARVAANGALPDLGLLMSYGQATLGDPFASSSFPATEQRWSVRLQTSTDLLRSAEKAHSNRADAAAQGLGISLKQKADDIRRQVRELQLAITMHKNSVALRQEQIKTAESKLALAELRFKHDMADNFAVIETRAELLREQLSFATAEMDQAMSVYYLQAMTGHLLDAYLDRGHHD